MLPISNGEILWTITVQFVGTCILGYVMSDVTAMLSRENIQTVMIREKIRELNSRDRPAPHTERARSLSLSRRKRAVKLRASLSESRAR